MMQSVDYLDAFQKQLNSKNIQMIRNKKSYQNNDQEEDIDNIKILVFRKAKNNNTVASRRQRIMLKVMIYRGKGRQDRKQGNNYKNRWNDQYLQKGEQQQQYQLVPKSVGQKTPTLMIKENSMNQNNFPSLDTLKK
ncbi:unnamed protein product [Paramecium sonneborni]|uniref:Uncharacterized protein n=1 Tax=Paramecium sonneborni TaxID=65129 RepID=A0A8S1KZQ0_9CILI|nr:unnamed protein product [Paramecium sonneborni]